MLLLTLCTLAGSYLAIYPTDSPGGYQLLGRTIQTWDSLGRHNPFSPSKPWLLDNFDQLVFEVVSDRELSAIRSQASDIAFRDNAYCSAAFK